MVGTDPSLSRRVRAALAGSAVAVYLLAVSVPAPESGIGGPDRVLHALGGATLALALAIALEGDRRPGRVVVGAVAGAVAVCLLGEAIQTWVPGRHPQSGDLLAGVVGSLVGAVLYRAGTRATRWND